MIQLTQDSPLQEEKTLSLVELIQDGGLGGQLIIGLLFILLIIVIYIYFERLFTIRSASKLSGNFMAQIRTYVLSDKIEGAQALCFMNVTDQCKAFISGPQPITGPDAFMHHKTLCSFCAKNLMNLKKITLKKLV